MAVRLTRDMTAVEVDAWYGVLADDPALARRVGVFIIRRSGQALPIGYETRRSTFLRDEARRAAVNAAGGGMVAMGLNPLRYTEQVWAPPNTRDPIVPPGSYGVLFVRDQNLDMSKVLPRVLERAAAYRAYDARTQAEEAAAEAPLPLPVAPPARHAPSTDANPAATMSGVA